MRHYPTGVTVVGTVHQGEKRGMTVNTFTSVSLNPLLVLICVSKDSGCHPLIDKSGVFSISALAEDQSDLSRRFAAESDVETHRFSGVAHHIGAVTGAPLLDGAVIKIECTVSDRIAAGDHTIFVGRVESAVAAPDRHALVFSGGGYSKVGAEITG